ncbi:sensor histidine kinase [Microvirga puerhi]|uniref:histidine kinase n=1 Tax=Microvirga puerhi TaxID=2876078 RepID=A0ABS7VSW9_9HYPH|nr:histidine kinase dimerization/phosphoacceptor domain -containing protein [Microvirga puerhi]MBZ6078027.1 DUF4118 domain-containing protein [Microvirga puerhi]
MLLNVAGRGTCVVAALSSPMQAFFAYSFETRQWPLWARYLTATVIIFMVYGLQVSLTEPLAAYPLVLFFVTIVINAALFDHGSGTYSTLLSAALIAYNLMEPAGSFRISDPHQSVGLALFVVAGIVTAAVIGNLHTLAFELSQANIHLAAAEQDKDLLLQEAGHRMKNDLALLTALVRLQAKTVLDPSAQAALVSTAERLHVMSRLQDRLKRENTTAVVDIRSYVIDLCDDLKTALIGLRPIGFKVAVEQHFLTEERAVATGLIVNELVTNSLKYAFPAEQPGMVMVAFHRENDEFTLIVSDDGIGLPFGPLADRESTGLGRRLIHAMAAQLGGTAVVKPRAGSSGTTATIRFPVNP